MRREADTSVAVAEPESFERDEPSEPEHARARR